MEGTLVFDFPNGDTLTIPQGDTGPLVMWVERQFSLGLERIESAPAAELWEICNYLRQAIPYLPDGIKETTKKSVEQFAKAIRRCEQPKPVRSVAVREASDVAAFNKDESLAVLERAITAGVKAGVKEGIKEGMERVTIVNNQPSNPAAQIQVIENAPRETTFMFIQDADGNNIGVRKVEA